MSASRPDWTCIHVHLCYPRERYSLLNLTIYDAPMFKISTSFAEDERPHLAELLWEGFEDKMIGLYGPKENGVAYFAVSFSRERLIGARTSDGHIVGMAGLRTPDGSFVPPSKEAIDRHYPEDAADKIISVAGLQDNVSDDDVLSIDILSVASAFQNKGLGTQLVTACYREAERLGFEQASVADLGDDGKIFGIRRVVTMQANASN